MQGRKLRKNEGDEGRMEEREGKWGKKRSGEIKKKIQNGSNRVSKEDIKRDCK
jgi:anti-sigma28 factor (negative regulator of flagellin synthesis)